MKKGTKGMGIALIGIGPKAKGDGKKPYDSEGEDEDEGSDELALSAADALISAVAEKDPEAVVSAFRSLKESC